MVCFTRTLDATLRTILKPSELLRRLAALAPPDQAAGLRTTVGIAHTRPSWRTYTFEHASQRRNLAPLVSPRYSRSGCLQSAETSASFVKRLFDISR